ncbi:6085_t:CDS:2 [Dentiscutata heterogama]|uniref:6085_t:CDS:1 n=1 Tax=Dentiscutata heterogama TaxID=1316150 RepID=A0ACA9KI64_9GLOM|nr:6085_t:CDS:2 [Dentiscutata heterogama]
MCEEAASLLTSNNSFLPPLVKENDGYYVNSIHLLEYLDIDKISGYDKHCPSVAKNYEKLSCSVCEKYFSTATMVATHKKSQHPNQVKRERPKKDAGQEY